MINAVPKSRRFVVSTLSRLRRAWPRATEASPSPKPVSFLAARQGSTAVVFSLAAVPLLALAGIAVDFGHGQIVREKMQSTLDATALAMAREAPNLSAQVLGQKASAFYASTAGVAEAKNMVLTAAYDSSTHKLTLNSSATIATGLSSILGYPSLAISNISQATSDIGNLDLTLVLDNTGSMAANGKIQALIAASHTLLKALETAAPAAGAVQVAIVPFDTRVNVGAGNAGAAWLDLSAFRKTGTFGGGPDAQVGGGGGGHCYDCDGVVDGAGTGWNGCVVDRNQPYDVQNTLPSDNPSATYLAANCGLAPIMPLNSNWTALNAEIDLMQAAGATNITIGLQWGWNMLTPGAPLSTAVAGQRDRYIVLLTDGLNTQNRWTDNEALIDPRMQAACTNIKADGIKLFTIRVVDGNAALLQGCASDPTLFFDASQASQVASAFAAMTQQLYHVHLTK